MPKAHLRYFINETLWCINILLFKNFEIEQIEKYENCSFQYEILFLETRLFSVFVNTWYTESILFSKQIDFVMQNSKLDSKLETKKMSLRGTFRPH